MCCFTAYIFFPSFSKNKRGMVWVEGCEAILIHTSSSKFSYYLKGGVALTAWTFLSVYIFLLSFCTMNVAYISDNLDTQHSDAIFVSFVPVTLDPHTQQLHPSGQPSTLFWLFLPLSRKLCVFSLFFLSGYSSITLLPYDPVPLVSASLRSPRFALFLPFYTQNTAVRNNTHVQ